MHRRREREKGEKRGMGMGGVGGGGWTKYVADDDVVDAVVVAVSHFLLRRGCGRSSGSFPCPGGDPRASNLIANPAALAIRGT